MIAANIFDIKRFGVNDGGGIRTVVFMKGCPLRCKWCHNPEGLHKQIRMWCVQGSCVGCKSCIAACPNGAVYLDDFGIGVDPKRCDLCSKCAKACPTGAMRPDGERMDVARIVLEAQRDRAFYGSAGGVTFSGGECTAHPEFLLQALGECEKTGIKTAVETCMYAPPEVMREVARAASEVIADIKLADSQRHKEATGVDNDLILHNFDYLAAHKKQLLIRIPLIPGYTADRENIDGIAAIIAKANPKIAVELINYNPLCAGKYRALREPFLEGAQPFTNAQIQEFQSILRARGLTRIL